MNNFKFLKRKIPFIEFKTFKVFKYKYSENNKNKQSKDDLKIKNQSLFFEAKEESAKEKYKDFTISTLKQQEGTKRRLEFETNKKFKEISKKEGSPLLDIKKVLLGNNFLFDKKKKSKDSKHKENIINNIDNDNINKVEILNLEEMKEMDLDFPILLYEVNEDTINMGKNLNKLLKMYSFAFVSLNLSVLFFNYLFFVQLNKIYLISYIISPLTFINVLISRFFKRGNILELLYNPKSNKIIMTRFKLLSFKKIEYLYFNVEDLELIQNCSKICFPRVYLRERKNKENIYALNEISIWHNLNLFNKLFGDLQLKH